MYAGATFVSAMIVTAFCCLIVGFGSGWLASKKCAKDDYRSCGHRYLEDQQIKLVLNLFTIFKGPVEPCHDHWQA